MGKQKWREEKEASSSTAPPPSKRYKPLDTPNASHLVQWLMEEVWWERMTWKKAQSGAKAGVADGLKDPHLLEIAGLGTMGFNEQNSARDSDKLSVLLEARAKSPPSYDFEVLALDPKSKEVKTVPSAATLLQDYLPCLEEHWPAHFEDHWQASSEKLEEFWNGCDLSDPKFFDHPMLQEPNWKQLYVPYFTHGDGGEFANQDSIMVCSSSPVLGRGETKDMKLLNWAWPYSVRAKGSYEGDGQEGSIEEHWLVYCWDMEAVFSGKRPLLDHRKRPFKGKDAWRARVAGEEILKCRKRLVNWGLLGDLDFFVNDLGLKHWNAKGEEGMCNFCGANTLPPENFFVRPLDGC